MSLHNLHRSHKRLRRFAHRLHVCRSYPATWSLTSRDVVSVGKPRGTNASHEPLQTASSRGNHRGWRVGAESVWWRRVLAEGGLDGEPRSAVECDNKLHQRSNEVEEGKCVEVVEAVQRQSRQAVRQRRCRQNQRRPGHATQSLYMLSDEVAKHTIRLRWIGTAKATESLQCLGGKDVKNCNRNFKTKFRNFKPNIVTSNLKFRNCKLKLHK